ncbi:hypothetical protein [Polaromonas sp. CF318]|uniref:hypothetical protein n=1 Tax=Polaromonas sp. CF318 TaxID=1144318 RepID=UPI0012FCC084|nr:hypothetical protein [Polaromonas sp. CF318]
MPFCPKCATTGDDNATACTVCGAPLPSSQELAANGIPEPQPFTIRTIVAIVLGLLSVYFGVLFFPFGVLPMLGGLALAIWLYKAEGKLSLFFAYVFSAAGLLFAFVVFAVLGAMLSSR